MSDTPAESIPVAPGLAGGVADIRTVASILAPEYGLGPGVGGAWARRAAPESAKRACGVCARSAACAGQQSATPGGRKLYQTSRSLSPGHL